MTSLAVGLIPLGTAWHDWGHGGAGWWIVAMVLFWGLLVGGLLLLFRGPGRGNGRIHRLQRESALEVLERRFAEGQLSVEDYQARRRILDPESDGD
jgi:putative membrane protein